MATGEERDLIPALPNLGNVNWFNWGSVNWTPDGRSLLVVSLSADKNRRGIFKIDAQSGEATLLVAPETRPLNPQLSPDGKTLYYMETISGRAAIVAFDLSSRNKRVVLEADGRYFILSPDGEQVAFPSDDWTTARLLVAPTKGGDARPLRETKTELLQPMGVSWSPDGRYVLFVERPDLRSPYELWRVPAQGGPPERLGLVAHQLHAPRAHPDGTRIAFSSGSGILGGLNGGGIEIWVLENFLPATSGAAPAGR
jgi:Tol biopolymer transport system component